MINWFRKKKSDETTLPGVLQQARQSTADFCERVGQCTSEEELWDWTEKALRAVFPVQSCVILRNVEGGWQVGPLRGEQTQVRGPWLSCLGWMRYNTSPIWLEELEKANVGAMRAVLAEAFAALNVNALIPLGMRDELFAVFACRTGTLPPNDLREIISLVAQKSALCIANMALGHEAGKLISLNRELEEASAIALSVPHEQAGVFKNGGWAAHFESAKKSGNDFSEVYSVSGDRCLVVLGDVVGQGIAASMLAAALKGSCDAAMRAKRALSPGELLALLSETLRRDQSSAGWAACLAISFDGAAGLITYANAGQRQPYLLSRQDGRTVVGSMNGTGPLLGDPKGSSVREVRFPWHGETVILFSQGLVSVRGRQGKELGERGLLKWLRQTPADALDAKSLVQNLRKKTAQMRAGMPLSADLSLVVVNSER